MALPKRTSTTITAIALGALLAGCGSHDPIPAGTNATSPAASTAPSDAEALSGTLEGAGASSQESAMDAWRAGFQNEYPDTTITYDPIGSSGGRKQFLAGGLAFAGTDTPLSSEELKLAEQRCHGAGVLEAPMYISPIAIIYNLPGVTELNLAPETIAKIFNQQINRWNDPAVVADNPDAKLPDLPITPVNRSDGSGTTQNFTAYLAATAGEAWPYEPADTWPVSGSQSALGTSGVVQTVQGGTGTIGYADASKAGDLGIARLKVGDQFVSYSAAAAAATVDASPRVPGLSPHQIVFDLDRATTAPGTYPLVLISYSVACLGYDDAAQADLVRAFLGFVASDAGQQLAASAAGSAPISPELNSAIRDAIDAIKTL